MAMERYEVAGLKMYQPDICQAIGDRKQHEQARR
jgi:hypothetical protein